MRSFTPTRSARINFWLPQNGREMHRIIFNDYVDASLAALFIALVISMAAFGLIAMRNALRSEVATTRERRMNCLNCGPLRLDLARSDKAARGRQPDGCQPITTSTRNTCVKTFRRTVMTREEFFLSAGAALWRRRRAAFRCC